MLQGVSYSFIHQNFFSNITRDYYASYKKLNNSERLSYIVDPCKVFVDSTNSYSETDLFLYHEFLTSGSLHIIHHFYIDPIESKERINLGSFYQDSEVNLYEMKVPIGGSSNNLQRIT